MRSKSSIDRILENAGTNHNRDTNLPALVLVGIESTAIVASGTAGDPREELCELARRGLLSEYERVCDCVSRTCGGTGGGGGRYRRESESPPQDGRHRHAVKTSMRYDGPRSPQHVIAPPFEFSYHVVLSIRSALILPVLGF